MRWQAQQPRDIPVRGNFDNPRTNKNIASQSRGKKNDEPVVRRNRDEPMIARRTDEPRRGKKDEPTRRTDEPNGPPHHPPATTTEKTSEPRPKKPPEDRFEVPHSPPILVSNPDAPVVPATPPTEDTPANPPTKVITATPQTPAKTQTPATPGPCNDHFADIFEKGRRKLDDGTATRWIDKSDQPVPMLEGTTNEYLELEVEEYGMLVVHDTSSSD